MNKSSLAIGVAALLLTGCSVFTRSAVSDRYENTVSKYTKHIMIERDFTDVLSIDVVYMNPEMKKAFVDEYAKIYMLPEQEKIKMFDEQKNNSEKWEEFILIVYSAPNLGSINGSDSIWKLYLKAGKRTEKPVYIDDLSSQYNLMKGFFPGVDSWDRLYLVRFNKLQPHPHDRLKFVVTGVLGNGEVSFKYE
ncbi:MAG: hypothetical protein M1381_05145 [Deltaproteobacteria bacterium]|nr:hypothetical protein [Deltaproteobacteria bacterium]MCL5791594.1 hypothetical protein [Deltaproteobacteria bacterium]